MLKPSFCQAIPLAVRHAVGEPDITRGSMYPSRSRDPIADSRSAYERKCSPLTRPLCGKPSRLAGLSLVAAANPTITVSLARSCLAFRPPSRHRRPSGVRREMPNSLATTSALGRGPGGLKVTSPNSSLAMQAWPADSPKRRIARSLDRSTKQKNSVDRLTFRYIIPS